MVALPSFNVPPVPRKPAWMDDVEVLREERDRDRDERMERFEDFDHDRRYAYSDGGDT